MPRGSTTLLELINKRKAWDEHGPTPPARPITRDYLRDNGRLIEGAVRVHALAHDSDPFAGARVRVHIMGGLEDHVDVYRLAASQLKLRTKEGVENFGALASIKKRLDEDAAWLAHNTVNLERKRQHKRQHTKHRERRAA